MYASDKYHTTCCPLYIVPILGVGKGEAHRQTVPMVKPENAVVYPLLEIP